MYVSSCHSLLFKGLYNVWSYGSPYANKKQALEQRAQLTRMKTRLGPR